MPRWAFFFLIIFVIEVKAAERPIIISGFDDVLRQADNTSLFNATFKIFSADKSFSGMSDLYNTISMNESSPEKFFLLSAISTWFENRIQKFMIKNQYPPNKRYLRNWLTEWSIEDFKISKVREILNRYHDRKFIVIFDNSNASLELAESIQSEFPEKVAAIYLRQVIEKKIPKGTFGFFTAFDIALNELKQNRLTKKEVIKIGEGIVSETTSENLLPVYAFCPEKYNPCLGVFAELVEICNKVQNKIVSICQMQRR